MHRGQRPGKQTDFETKVAHERKREENFCKIDNEILGNLAPGLEIAKKERGRREKFATSKPELKAEFDPHPCSYRSTH
jgi:hypothetical protein